MPQDVQGMDDVSNEEDATAAAVASRNQIITVVVDVFSRPEEAPPEGSSNAINVGFCRVNQLEVIQGRYAFRKR